MSRWAPRFRRSTSPGLGVSSTSSTRDSAAISARRSAAKPRRRRSAAAWTAGRPWARLRAQGPAGPPQTRHRRGSPRESFRPSVPITSTSSSRPTGRAVSSSMASSFSSAAGIPHTRMASSPEAASVSSSRTSAVPNRARRAFSASQKAKSIRPDRFTGPAIFIFRPTSGLPNFSSSRRWLAARASRASSTSCSVTSPMAPPSEGRRPIVLSHPAATRRRP